jgi:SAM-dependent methyltransferase
MAPDDVMATVMRLMAQMEGLAAIGARATLAADGVPGDPVVTPHLDRVLEALGVDLAGLPPVQLRQMAGTIRTFLLQAAELLESPGRAPGWAYADPALLQSIGHASSGWPMIVAEVPELAGLARPGARFLDVGTGVGLLAIAACRRWPDLTVVGLDPWEPSLALARRNRAEAGLDARLELRRIGIEALEDEATYDVAWLPAPFLPPAVLELAVTRAHAALVPGGWVVLGYFGAAPEPLSQAVAALRVVRGGGRPLLPDRAAALLTAAGFSSVQALPPHPKAGPMRLVIGHT